MDKIEVTIKSLLPTGHVQGLYQIRIGREETVEQLIRLVCAHTRTIFRDDFCLRSKEHHLLNRNDRIAEIGLQEGAYLHWTSEGPEMVVAKEASGCCRGCNVYYFLAFVAILIGITGIVTLFVIKFKPLDPIIDYAVVFDAGSSHTSMYIYKWDGSKHSGTALAIQSGFCKVKEREISYFVNNPKDAGKTLEKCLKAAEEAIPKDKHSTTPVYLGATAGMRLVNISHPMESDAIMESVRSTLKASSFSFTTASSARIISGFDEGSFSWITSNYISNGFDVLKYRDDNGVPASVIVDTLGALDLGGASTQISFIPKKNTAIPSGYSNELELFGVNYTLYTHSYLCYGTNQIKLRIMGQLIKENPQSTAIVHKCLPQGFNLTQSYDDIFDSPCITGENAVKHFGSSIDVSLKDKANRNYTFMGTNDTKGCEDLISQTVINSSMPCPFSSCSFNGIYQPPVTGVFYAFSSYSYTTSFLNLTKPGHNFINHSDFLHSMNSICQTPWKELIKIPKSSVEFLPWYCQNAVYMDVLLSQGYHVGDKEWLGLNFVEKVSGSEVGWTLGFVLNESNAYPSDEPSIILYTVTFALLLVLFVLFLVVGTCLCCHGRQVRVSNGMNYERINNYQSI